MKDTEAQSKAHLSPYLTPLGAWALALGTAIGWGSLVVTSNTYLLQAGPWGSIIGLLLGAVVMLVVGRNYHYMINCFPDAGGAYTYAKEIFGHDYGFLTAWFLGLTYIAMFWANATSLPLFAHYFLGDVFRFGYLYTVFGYDVYFGEALLSIAAILLFAALCARSRVGTMRIMIVSAVLLTAAIAACFLLSVPGFAAGSHGFEPGFIPDKSALSQVLLIACISPWAFIGFENISHAAEEYAFPRDKVYRIMVAAVITATVLYVLVLLLSVMACPPEYASWLDYISDLGNLDGIKGLPAFYTAYHYLGSTGVNLLMVALLGLIVTSLIGNVLALSRLFYALAKDSVLPGGLAGINERHIPGLAIALVAGFSIAIPFLGRTAIGWIVDVTTIGATITYGLVSASTAKVARARGDATERATGVLGIVIMLGFGAHLILPSLFSAQTLAPESFFLFATWGIIGFVCFRILLSRDAERRFGRSAVVWIALLSLVMFVTFIWMDQSIVNMEGEMADNIATYLDANETQGAITPDTELYVDQQIASFKDASLQTMLVAALLFALAAAMLLMNFSYLSRWARESEEELGQTRNIIYTDPLTGLPSMTRFNDLAREGAAAILARGGRPVAIAFDLVGMNAYTEKHGRDGGDKLLRAFANALREHFGDEACSRFAEDHFYAFAPEEGLSGKLETLFAEFEGMTGIDTLPVRAGACECGADSDIVAVGFNRARSACDFDRKTWQSHVTWFVDDMNEEARMRLHVLDNVDNAIANRWIRPYYQAIVSPVTGNVCAEEALSRWIDPESGFLSPGQFIPILEEAGVLHKVDMHMVDCVLSDMAVKRGSGVEVVPVSVNISLRDVGRLDIADEIIGKVDALGISHDLLRIEFTESAASDDPEVFKREVDALRTAGFQVWMDDFGSGYSSLNSLKDFDFDLVKLDMDFINDEKGAKTWDVVAGVVQIIEKLGMRSLAEGVETELQAARLADAGCDFLQGYHFAKPQPLEDVIAQALDGSGIPRGERGER